MGFDGIYPLGMTNIAMENGPQKQLIYHDLPIENGDFPHCSCVELPEGTALRWENPQDLEVY